MRWFLPTCLLSFLLYSCDPNSGFVDTLTPAQAYVPVYADLSDAQVISVEPVQATRKAGKIYAFRNYILQNDINTGIHIIDNADPAHPKKIAFLKIPYCTEIAVKDYYLYTNAINDLVVFDIHDPEKPTEVKRIKGAFPLINQEHPPFSDVYFFCADPSKGIVVDWQLEQVQNLPPCRR